MFVFVAEIIGTVAFAWAGALTAVKRKMDVFGIMILGLVTATGGGLFRDLILGVTPPVLFQKPVYAMVSIGTSLLIFFIIRFNPSILDLEHAQIYRNVLEITDALGLGIFTVVGANACFLHGSQRIFLPVFLGALTGVGGGMLRDMMCAEIPYIFKKHVYAVASLVGAIVFVLLHNFIKPDTAMLAGAAAVVLIRYLAIHFEWNLPKALR